MKLSHRPAAVSSAFDDPNLVSAAGLVPAMGLASSTGLGALVDEHLHLPDHFGANAGLKVSALVAGMLAGAGCIDDMGILRHGGMDRLFKGTYAPSTLGSFLRQFTFGHVRQLDAAAGRWLVNLAAAAPITVPTGPATVPAAAPAAMPPAAAPRPVPTGWDPGAPVIGSRFASLSSVRVVFICRSPFVCGRIRPVDSSRRRKGASRIQSTHSSSSLGGRRRSVRKRTVTQVFAPR